MTDALSGRRFVLYNRQWSWVTGGGIFAEPAVTGCLGPVTMLSSETGRLSVTLEDPLRDAGGEVGLLMQQGPTFILARDVVVLGQATPSGSVSFNAPHPDFHAVLGCVRITHGATANGLLATLEILDRDGNTVTIVEWSPPLTNGTGKHGGGGWGWDIPK